MRMLHHIAALGARAMRPITLRNLPQHVARAVTRRAAERRTSLNKAVISLLEEVLGSRALPAARYHDLDELSGSWAREEAAEFDATLRDQRAIDPDVWR